jgi:FkbM family methyltransferase
MMPVSKVADIYTDPKFYHGFPIDPRRLPSAECQMEADWIKKSLEEQSRKCYRFAEIGAGYGRWSVYAAALAGEIRPDLTVSVIAVEPEPTHFCWLAEHLNNNGVENIVLFNRPVSDRASIRYFHTGNPSAWYGQYAERTLTQSLMALFSRKYVGSLVKTITLDDVLAHTSRVDFVDLDIQGEELSVLTTAKPETLAKIRLLYIGTHSPEIERGLHSLMAAYGWTCEEDIPQDPDGGYTDGIQVWRNPQ